MSMEEKQVIVNLGEEEKSIRAIAQASRIVNTIIWNALKKKETTGRLTSRHRTGRLRQTTETLREL